MARGRKKLPDTLKVVQGTFQKCRASKAGDRHDEAPMVAPESLSEAAQKHFETLRGRIAELGLDSATYSETLALAAMRLDEIAQCDAIITEHGRIIETTTEAGSLLLRANPAVAMRDSAMRHLQSLLAEFGLTPTSAARIGAKKPAPAPKGFGGL